MEGTIEKWLEDKNFGFVKVEGREKGIFFHRNSLVEGYTPREGDAVEFEEEQSEKGPNAVNVRAAGAAPD